MQYSNNRLTIGLICYNEEQKVNFFVNNCHNINIIAVDSFSDDKTVEKLMEFNNVKVYQNKFVGYASQRQFLLEKCATDFLLFLDADEWLSEGDLKSLINDVNCADWSIGEMRRNEYLNGQLLRRSMQYPVWFGRVLRVRDCTIRREINEVYETDGISRQLPYHINHDFMAQGFEKWRDKQIRYARLEAYHLRKNSFALNGNLRQKCKSFIYYFNLGPIMMFVYLFFIKLCFLEGKRGMFIAACRVLYELEIIVSRYAPEKSFNDSIMSEH